MPHKVKRWAWIWIVAQSKCCRISLGEQSSIGKAWSKRTNQSLLCSIVVILFKSSRMSILACGMQLWKKMGFRNFWWLSKIHTNTGYFNLRKKDFVSLSCYITLDLFSLQHTSMFIINLKGKQSSFKILSEFFICLFFLSSIPNNWIWIEDESTF